MRQSIRAVSTLMAVAAVTSACDTTTGPGESLVPEVDVSRAVFDAPQTFPDAGTTLEKGKFTVCKVASDDPSMAFTFNSSIDPTGAGLVPSVDLTDGQCEDVYVAPQGSAAREVTVTEVVPDGWTLDRVEVWSIFSDGSVVREADKAGPTVVGPVDFLKEGCVVVFYNSKVSDNTGGQGCTPGYWKGNAARKNAVSWGPTGVGTADPLTSVGFSGFSALAGDATSFEDALSARGGGEFALMRHAAAAYLNAAHPDISYDLTTTEIVAAVNAALASGDRGVIEELKDELDEFNNQGCPIDQFGRVVSG